MIEFELSFEEGFGNFVANGALRDAFDLAVAQANFDFNKKEGPSVKISGVRYRQKSVHVMCETTPELVHKFLLLMCEKFQGILDTEASYVFAETGKLINPEAVPTSEAIKEADQFAKFLGYKPEEIKHIRHPSPGQP